MAEKLLDDIIEAVDTVEKMIGSEKLAANIIAKARQGNINWRRVLEHELGQTKLSEPRINKTRPDKRTGNVPSLKRQSVPEIVAYVDTSGSVSDRLLKDFINELGGIARQMRIEITVIPYSVGAATPQKLKADGQLHITDRGGTSLEKALNDTFDIARRAETIVIFTDGYDNFPNTLSQLKAKKIFVKPGDDKDVANDFFKHAARFGKVITINKPSGWL
jgi:predicted metal-dependent peptidase